MRSIPAKPNNEIRKSTTGISKFRSLKSKITLILAACIFLASLISAQVFLQYARSELVSERLFNLMFISTNTASLLDAKKLATIKIAADEGNDAYLELQKQIQSVRDTSEGKINFIYIIAKSGDSCIYILDAVPIEDKENHSSVGSEFSLIDFPEANQGFIEPTVEKTIMYDQEFKTWSQTGYAPIKDAVGKVIGVIGVDMDLTQIKQNENQMNKALYGTLLISLACAVFIGFYFSGYITRPLFELAKGTRMVAAGNLDAEVVINRKDEIGYLAGAFNSMTRELKISHVKLGERNLQLNETVMDLNGEIGLRKQAQERIAQLAYHDSLTGLPNRLLLIDRLDQAIDLAKRIMKPIGILFLDLDGFKLVNDTLGHHCGDEVLKIIADKLVDTVRKSDTVSRVGGDEFIIVVQNLSSADDILKVANKIKNTFSKPIEIHDREFRITASIGVSIFPVDGETSQELVKNADLAMYKAKMGGKNRFVLCTVHMKENVDEIMKMTNGLYRALQNNELEVYYQPQVSVNSKKIVGLEALLRWKHPEYGMMSPEKFIPLAEQTGLIVPIGEWVIRNVCRQNKKWQDEGLPIVRVAINLSIVQFQSPEIVNRISRILLETGLSSEYLELEITESVAIGDQEHVISVLNKFHELGLYISVDDFGTEYSSLQYLKSLPVDRIKIPMPFIQGINKHEKDEAIVQTIIALANNMGMHVIAEGVDTEDQESFLTQRMCDVMQGFHYYKPMTAQEVEVLLREINT